MEDAVSAHQRPKLEHYKGSTFLVFKTLLETDPHHPLRLGEISVFLGENFVVTVRHGAANPLSGVRHRVEGQPELLQHGPSAVLYAVADAIVDSYTSYAQLMQDSIDELETEVFSPVRGDYGGPIYALKRNAIVFARAVMPLVMPTKALVAGEEDRIAKETQPYFRDVADHVLRATDGAREWNELLDHMLDADRSRVSVQQNDDMRRISAWAAILAIPTAIAGIYGMNFDDMPELHYHYSYYVVLGIMATVVRDPVCAAEAGEVAVTSAACRRTEAERGFRTIPGSSCGLGTRPMSICCGISRRGWAFRQSRGLRRPVGRFHGRVVVFGDRWGPHARHWR